MGGCRLEHRSGDGRIPPLARARAHASASLLTGLVGVLWVYAPPALLAGDVLRGLDYQQLHQVRIEYASAALRSAELPGWFTREQLGTPFLANLQSFPWIPTRFPLYAFAGDRAFGVGVLLSAVLAALFTWLYCRRLGIGPWAASAAGWTFACAGYFSARVLAGHLPLLEAYPALPLLLWLSDRARERPTRSALVALAAATAATCLAGHPQLPCYAVGATLLVSLRGPRRALRLGALGTGIGLSLFAWVPCLLLIRRSSRILPLELPPSNDISLPWGRLAAFLSPWRDGQPAGVAGAGAPFSGYPNAAYFWDTVGYVGWLPLLALVGLAIRAWRTRSRDDLPRGLTDVLLLGLLALVLALPWVDPLRERLPVVILRSPARQLYVTTFALACGLGFGLHALARWLRPRWRVLAVIPAALQVADLGLHSRRFVRAVDPDPVLPAQLLVSPQRVASDGFVGPLLRRNDRVGVFDSLMLARSWVGLHRVTGLEVSPDQYLFAGQADARVLEHLEVRLVATSRARADPGLELLQAGPVHLYRLRAPPRSKATFFPAGLTVACRDQDDLWERLTPETFGRLLLLVEPASGGEVADPRSRPVPVEYERPTSDRFHLDIQVPEAGVLRLMESYDAGWEATVDGRPAEVLAGDGFTLAVRLPPGRHEVRFSYRTPGRLAGVAGSLLVLALGLLALSRLGGVRGGTPTRRST